MYVQHTLDVIGFNGDVYHAYVIIFFGDNGGKSKAVAVRNYSALPLVTTGM